MESLIQSMKLLSDETRLRVAMLLYQGEFCVCQLTGITGLAQPKISKALSKMRDLNLVNDFRQDKYVYYQLKTDLKIIGPLLDSIIDTIEAYPRLLEDQNNIQDKQAYLSNCQANIGR